MQEVKEVAGDQIRQAAADLKASGGEALQSAKEAGTHFVDEQKEKLAGQLDHYKDAVKSACEKLQSTDGSPLIEPAQRASRQMERAADYLRSHDTLEFLDDLGAFARRRPEIVFGGLFVVGLASVRFLKASSRDRRNATRASGSSMNYQPTSRAAYPLTTAQPIS